MLGSAPEQHGTSQCPCCSDANDQHKTWPPGLVLIIGITAAWALGSAMLLRRAAEHLRETALNDLRRFRLLAQENEVKRHTFDELIAEIRDLKTGAFAPLSDQPFVRAVLFPGAGLG